jgi:hypothetical protein
MEIPRQFQNVYFHVSDRANRRSIESTGTLRATPIYNGEDEETGDNGVFVTKKPNDEYGHDIYAADLSKYPIEDVGSWHYNPQPHDYVVLNRNISDVKRVGHFYETPNGQTEVHWHKEEDCNA